MGSLVKSRRRLQASQRRLGCLASAINANELGLVTSVQVITVLEDKYSGNVHPQRLGQDRGPVRRPAVDNRRRPQAHEWLMIGTGILTF